MVLAEAAAFAQQAAASGRNIVTRFAPSPNGYLHLGHAYAAIAAHDFARAGGGRFLLRIEDIDGSRSRREYADAIVEDLQWLGLGWDGDVIFQSTRSESYAAALERLKDKGLVYPCICTRKDIAAALKKQPARHGPDGPVYPGTCRHRDIDLAQPHCWRLDMARAIKQAGQQSWFDLAAGLQRGDPALFGDIVLWRKDAPASYHLAATLDDAGDGITHIVRGMDLFAYSGLHRLLQQLLDLPEPAWWHHPLIVDEQGDKLAKSRKSASLRSIRASGMDGFAFAVSLRNGELPLGMTLSKA